MALGGGGNDRSSESDSGGAGWAGGAPWKVFEVPESTDGAMKWPGLGTPEPFATASKGVESGDSSFGADLECVAGVSAMVECLPVVQGGMARNSSKVSTRGVQHCQPKTSVSAVGTCDGESRHGSHLSDPHAKTA